MVSNISDKEVIKAIELDDTLKQNRAFAWLYGRYFKPICTYVTINNGTDADAADIFQDSLEIFYRKVKSKKYQYESSIGTYLYGVAKNLWLKKLRKDRFDFARLEMVESYTFDVESIILGSRPKINDLLEDVGTTCKCLIIEFYYHGKSMTELMNIYKLSSSEAARNKKYRCMQRLMNYVRVNNLKKSDFKYD